MTELYITKAGSYQSIKILKTLFRGVTLKSVKIEMNYDNENGLPREYDRENWPFKATIVDVNHEIYIVHIYTFTVGYGGTGPHDFESVLNFFKRKLGHDRFILLEFSR